MKFLVVAIAALSLVGCGGGGGGGGGGASAPSAPVVASGQTIFGTAAFGAAAVGGTVEAKCLTGTAAATTASDGTFTLTAPGLVAPCILQLTYGTSKLYSLGSNEGRVNVTPITDMIANMQTSKNTSASQYFTNFGKNEYSIGIIADPLSVGKGGQLITTALIMLRNETALTISPTYNPMTDPQIAAVGQREGDSHDKLIDEINARLKARGKSLDGIVSEWKTAPDAPRPGPGDAFKQCFIKYGDFVVCLRLNPF